MSEQTYWCVFDPAGEPYSNAFRKAEYARSDARWWGWATVFKHIRPTWKQLYRKGYRCKRVRIEVCDD